MPSPLADVVEKVTSIEKSPPVPVTNVKKSLLDNLPKTQAQEIWKTFSLQRNYEFIIMISAMRVVLLAEKRFPGSSKQTRTRRKRSCLVTYGCAKLISLTVQKVDTGGLCLSKVKGCTMFTLHKINKRNFLQSPL